MKKTTTTALERLFKKVNRYECGEYGGLFTPTEILLLIDLGASSPKDLNWYKEHKKKGDSEPQWFYFRASKKLKEHPMWIIKNNNPR